MLERIRHLNRKILLLLGIALFIAAAGSNVRNVNADEHREGDVVYLDSEIREVSDDTVNEWALDAGLIEKAVDSEKICTRMDLVRILWIRNCRPENKAEAMTTKLADVREEDKYAALWAYKNGICAVDAEKRFKPDTEMTHGDVLQTLWFVKGRPAVTEEITGFENLSTSSTYYLAALWAAEQKLLIKDEKTYFNGSEKCRLIDAVRYIYYQYHIRSTFPITRKQFVEACEFVTIEARENGYRYGDSNGIPPTSDGYISCDRLVAKALWDLGYTDQGEGGFYGSDMFGYLLDHGFVQSTDPSDIGYGSIVCTTAGDYGHTFVSVSWDPSSGSIVKYDEGSDSRINSVQPAYEYWGGEDFRCVFNIPDE